MDPSLLRDALTVAAGVLTGILSGMFGVGGAVISTPAIRLLGASAAVAVGTTLPAIIPGAVSGTARYAKEGVIDWRVVAWTAPVGVACAVGGSVLSKVVPGDGHLLMLLTAALLGFSAWRMYRSHGRAGPVEPESDAEVVGTDVDLAPDTGPGAVGAGSGAVGAGAPPRTTVAGIAGAGPRFAVVGAMAGLLSGLLGVGGGIVMVPGFTQVGRLPVKQAIGTSLACVAIFAVPGTVTHALLGDIDWRFALLLAVGVIPGARIGAALTMRSSDRRMQVVVAAFLGTTAALFAAGELLALT